MDGDSQRQEAFPPPPSRRTYLQSNSLSNPGMICQPRFVDVLNSTLKDWPSLAVDALSTPGGYTAIAELAASNVTTELSIGGPYSADPSTESIIT